MHAPGFSMARSLVAVSALVALTLSGCDCAGKTGQPPTVRIVTPADGTLFSSPGPHLVSGEVSDPDEVLTDDRIVWKSSRDGTLAFGASSSIVLSLGEHRLSLEATDRDGNVSTAQVTVRVSGAGPTDGGVDDGGTSLDGGNLAPSVTITSPANGAFFDEGMAIALSGSAVDPEDGPLTGGALVWTSDRAGVIGSGAQVSFTNAQLGVHRVVLTATDGAGATALASISLEVVRPGTNRPPVVTLTAPGNGAQLTLGTSTTLQGSATDVEDGVLMGTSLVWTSSLDGPLGTGAMRTATLTQGVHTLTLTATDSMGATGSASVTVSVNQPNNQPPTATITRPSAMQTIFQGASLTFIGVGNDPEDGALTGASLSWSSSLDGLLGTGSPLVTSTLTVGNHVITLVARDSGGNSGTATLAVQVLPMNQAPVVAITSPTTGFSAVAGTSITFTGTATDAEDGALSGAAVRWSSSLDGALGTGLTLSTASLSVGTHSISLVATDSGGRTGSANITVVVTMAAVNVPPLARLTGPSSGSTADTLTFDGSTSTDSDGTLVSYRFDFGDGSMPVTSTMTSAAHAFATPGTYTVTLTVTDDRGATSSATLTVTITAFVRVPVVALPTVVDVGDACAIATPGSRVFLAWTTALHPALFFGERVNGVMQAEVVDSLGFNTGGLVRQLVSMQLDASLNPHLVYVRDNQVFYATKSGGVWLRERVDSVTAPYTTALAGDAVSAPSIALNGTVPSVLYATGTTANSVRPVIAVRTGANTWAQNAVVIPSYSASYEMTPKGELAIDGAGRHLFPVYGVDVSPLAYVHRLAAWTSASTTTLVLPSTSSARLGVTMTSPTRLLMMSGSGVLEVTLNATFPSSTTTLSPVELSGTTQHAIAADVNGWPRLLLRHGSGDLEAVRSLGAPGFWSWEGLGAVSSGAVDVSVDGANETRGCFIRAGKLMLY